uniref:Uncharacterized protein n=1 Tax=Anguilla anguilla TaxID=7936 RepID=A0A0E9W677_ANGAN
MVNSIDNTSNTHHEDHPVVTAITLAVTSLFLSLKIFKN